MRIINKFGGEIIGNPRLAKLAVKRIEEQLRLNRKPVAVVSALAGVTDKLVKLSQNYNRKIFNELINQHKEWAAKLEVKGKKLDLEIDALKKELEMALKILGDNKLSYQDRILSYGEKFSSLFFTEILFKNGIPAKRFTGEELGIITDENFGDANVRYEESVRNIKSKLKNIFQVPVITGFIGKTSKGKTTTLGRGGSDTTACLVGAALNSSKVILWKNVPGVLSADPKIVKNAKTIKSLTYGEAEESGKVIHNKAIRLVNGKDVIIEVAYIADPAKKTIVVHNASRKKGVKIISSKANLFLLTIKGGEMDRPGTLYKLTKVINEEGINIVLIRDTKESVYVGIEKNNHDLTGCLKKIRELGYRVLVKEVAMVNAIGNLDWKIAERFNQLLYKFCPEVELGAFPYRKCLMLEAIIRKSKVKKLIRTFHKELICK